jgi:hypothetical protein
MSYTYSKVDDLEDEPVVGSHQCVALVQIYAGAPITSAWREGDPVLGNGSLAKGTAIATFVDGRYPNNGEQARQVHSPQRQCGSLLGDRVKTGIFERLR